MCSPAGAIRTPPAPCTSTWPAGRSTPGYRYVWVFQEPDRFRWLEERYPGTAVVKWASPDYQRAMATAKYWIFNYRVSDHIWPRPDQVYLECWHGTPLKRLGYDLTTHGNVMNSVSEIRQKYDLDAAKFRYILSPSPFATEKFISAWNLRAIGKEDAVIQEGYPRNDFLLNHTQEDVDRVKRELHITREETGGRRVILYAPTWRDNQHDSSIGYSYQLGVDFDQLRRDLGGSTSSCSGHTTWWPATSTSTPTRALSGMCPAARTSTICTSPRTC